MHFSARKKILEVQILGPQSPPLFRTTKKSYSNRSRLWDSQFLNFMLINQGEDLSSIPAEIYGAIAHPAPRLRGSDGPSSISLWCSLNLRQGDTFTLFKNKSLWLLAMNSLQTCKGLKVNFNKIDVFFHPSNSLKRIYEKVPKSTDAEGDVSKLSGAGNMHNWQLCMQKNVFQWIRPHWMHLYCPKS